MIIYLLWPPIMDVSVVFNFRLPQIVLQLVYLYTHTILHSWRQICRKKIPRNRNVGSKDTYFWILKRTKLSSTVDIPMHTSSTAASVRHPCLSKFSNSQFLSFLICKVGTRTLPVSWVVGRSECDHLWKVLSIAIVFVIILSGSIIIFIITTSWRYFEATGSPQLWKCCV